MSMRVLAACVVVIPALVARAGPVFDTDPSVIVELLPDNPGPYYGGEHVTADIWLHSRAPWDVYLQMVRLDFHDTDTEIALSPFVNFDMSSVPYPGWYEIHPELPVPSFQNDLLCICPPYFLLLPSDSALRIADVGVALPTEPGRYLLDVLNADEPQNGLGAEVKTTGFYVPPFWWRAYEGEIVGGVYEFVIIPEPATLWLVGLCALVMHRCRARSASRKLSGCGPARAWGPRSGASVLCSRGEVASTPFQSNDMAWRMCLAVASAVLFSTSLAQAGPVFDTDPSIVVELVPDNPGPYYGGERVTVDIWLHSRVTFDEYLDRVRLDFWDTSPEIALDPALTFDLTSVGFPDWYDVHPELPLPWLLNEILCVCPGAFLPLASQGSLHIADVGMTLPTEPGRYLLDVLNADEPQIGLGAEVRTAGFYRPPFWWRAYDGDIVGGVHEFVIIPEPESLWLLGLCGVAIWRYAGRSASRNLPRRGSRRAHSSDRLGNCDRAWRMCLAVASAVLFCTSLAQAGPVFDTDPSIVVELVPDNPGPYYGGERVTVDIYLHSRVPWSVFLREVRLDFGDTSPGIALDPALTFDLTSSHSPGWYDVHPELPLPWLLNEIACVCPSYFLYLPDGGSLHIADVGMTLPTEPGGYLLDVLNADEPDRDLGAEIETTDFYVPPFWWRAYEGEIVGGVYEFVIIPEPASLWLVGLCGLAICLRRGRSASCKVSDRASARACGVGHAVALPSFARWALAVACSLLALPQVVRAQPAETPVQRVPLAIDSGLVSAPAGGVEPVVVFAETVCVEGAPWLRLHQRRPVNTFPISKSATTFRMPSPSLHMNAAAAIPPQAVAL